MRKALYLFCYLSLCYLSSNSQDVDSLLTVLGRVENDSLESAILYEIGVVQQNVDSSLFYYHKALSVSESIGDLFGIGKCNAAIGSKKFYMNELDSANYYWLLSEAAFKKLNSTSVFLSNVTEQLSNIYYSLSIVNYYKGNFRKTLEYIQLSLGMRLEQNMKRDILNCYNILGIVHLAEDEFDMAEKHFTNGLTIAKELNDTAQISNMYNNLAGIYLSVEKYDSALNYYQSSLSLIKDESDTWQTKMNIGNTLKFLGQYDSARMMLEEGVRKFAKTDNTLDKIVSLNLLGDLYLEIKDWQKLVDVSNKSMKLLEEVPAKEQKKFSAYNLSVGQENLGLLKESFENYKLYTALKDSLFDEQKTKEIEKLEAQFEFEQNQREIGTLTEENLKNEIQITNDKNTKIILLGIIGFSVLVFVLVFVLYRRKQEKKRHSLAVKKLEIEQRMLRSQMNPHFLFNALNSIQSYVSTNQTYEAEVFLSKFSLLVRNILENSTHEYISLDEEIETLKLYLELEKLRFDDKFESTIDDQLMDSSIQIPPMLVQPFVENAIIHGMKGKRTKGHIEVRFSETVDNMILCEVIDDGVGRKSNGQSTNHRSLATQLTNDRLQFFNQSKNGNFKMDTIDLVDNQGRPMGTKVELLIPFDN